MNQFRFWAVCLLLCLICSGVSFAQGTLPQPDAKGNYQGRYLHQYWMVVDPDPAGFNGRLTPKWPANWDALDANWPDTRMIKPDWPVVVRFNRGRILRAMLGNTGLYFVRDGRGCSWLLVSAGTGKPGAVCFVRANSKFIKPVTVSDSGPGLATADQKGNFTNLAVQNYWKVVGDGLQGRLSKTWPANWDAMDANWPDTKDVAQWPLANTFAKGDILFAGSGNRGLITVQDAAGNPWILATTGPGPNGAPRVCFIPASNKYLQPVVVRRD